ncbi:MAG: hypothetical protein ACTSP4_00545 [Candidatus Hodarchaeales archaeon]
MSEEEGYSVADDSVNDEQKSFLALIHRLFFISEDGKIFLEKANELFKSAPVFPINPEMIQSFGGDISIYSGFRAGQANVIQWIEDALKFYEQSLMRRDDNV